MAYASVCVAVGRHPMVTEVVFRDVYQPVPYKAPFVSSLVDASVCVHLLIDTFKASMPNHFENSSAPFWAAIL